MNPARNFAEFSQFWDAWTLRHLDAWLDNQVHGDTCRAEVREAMLNLAADDPEWWSNNSYTLLYDNAKCWDIEARYR